VEYAVYNQEGRKMLIECVGINMQGNISNALCAIYITGRVTRK
jgi:hypothetical protein